MNPDSLFKGSTRPVAATFLALLLLLRGSSLSAADISWTNPAGGNWSDPNNWSGGTVPSPGDDASIEIDGTYAVIIDQGAAAAKVTVGGQTGIKTLNWTSGIIVGQFIITTNGVLSITGDGTKQMSSAILENHGTVTWSGTGPISLDSGSRIENAMNALFEAQAIANLGGQGGTIFENRGTLRRNGNGGTSGFYVFLQNAGNVEAHEGRLALGAGSDLGGVFWTEGSANILFGFGLYTIRAAPTFSGSGAVSFGDGATITFTGPITNYTHSGGSITGTNVLYGTMNWTGGTIKDQFTVAPGGVLRINGEGQLVLVGELVNEGTIEWLGQERISMTSGVIRNRPGGVFDIRSDQIIASPSGTVFENAGLVRKSAGTNTTAMAPLFHNTGTVEAQTGTLALNGGNLAGTFAAAAGAKITLDGATLGVPPVFNGPGTVQFVGSAPILFTAPITNFHLNGGTLRGTNIVTGTMNWTGGAIRDQLTVAPGGILRIAGEAQLVLAGELINEGTIEWLGEERLDMTSGIIRNRPDALFDIRSDLIIASPSGTVFENAGLVRKSAGTNTTAMAPLFHNTGSVEAQTGTLALNGGDLSGMFSAAAGAEITLAGARISSPPTFNGPGRVGFVGTTPIVFTGPITNFELNGGTLAGTNIVTGTLNWTGGNIGGPLIVASNGVLNISGTAEKRFSSLIRNEGTVNCLSGFFVGGRIENAAGALFDIQADFTLAGGGGGGPARFDNMGVLRKSAGEGTANIHVPFHNSGFVEVNKGTLLFDYGGTLDGRFRAEADASILFAAGGGVYTLNALPDFGGAGRVEFTPNGPYSFTVPLPDFDLKSGILGGTNIVTGTWNWTGGNVGTLIVASNGVLNISGAAEKRLTSLIRNEGTIHCLSAFFVGGVIENTAGALFDVRSDFVLSGGGGGGPERFNNQGVFRKSNGSGTMEIYMPFTNAGTVEAQLGTIAFNSGLKLFPSSVLDFIFSGVPPQIDYGRVTVPNHLILDGTLKVSGTTGFMPLSGDLFEVLTFASRSSGFLRDEGLELSGDPFFRVESTDRSLSFVAGSFLGIPQPPATNLADQVVAVGRSVSFRIEPLGTGPFIYRWQFNANNIPRATNSIFTINSAQTANAGIYSVQVTDALGLVAMYSANLRVLLPPAITTQPGNQTVSAGSSVALAAGIAGDGPLSYQWRLNGANIPGATNETYVIGNAQPGSGGSYSVTLANPVGAVRSAVATVVVRSPDLLLSDSFAGRSRASTASGVGSGTNTNATTEPNEPDHADKRGGRSVWFEWRAPASGIAKFSTRGSTFDTLLGVYIGSDLLDLIPVASDDDRGGFFTSEAAFQAASGSTYLIAVDGLGGASGDIVLSWTLDTSVSSLPRIVAHPSNRTVVAGANTSFTVLATSTGTLRYQWLLNDYLRVDGATNATLVLTNVRPEMAGRYLVEITNQNGERVRSEAASLEVSTDARSFSEDKFRDILERNRLAGFAHVKAAAAGFPSVSSGTLGTQILNNFNSTIELGEPLHAAVVGGSSRWFILKALEQATMVVDTAGSAIDTVLAVYTGTDIFTLREIAADNDSAFDGIRSRVRFEAEAGIDYLIAVDGVKGAQGDVVLNWGMGQVPTLTTIPSAQSIKAGGTIRFEAATTGRPSPSFQWQFEGRNIAGARDSVLVIPNVTAAHAGRYRVIVSNFIGSVTSGEFVCSVEEDRLAVNPASLKVENGALQFAINGGTAKRVVVESTGSLALPTVWTPIWTNSPNQTATEFTDSTIQTRSLRFYRARLMD